MHVISRKTLRAFWTQYVDAEEPLRAWHQVARAERWRSFAEIRAMFPHADKVGRFIVFNIGGNKYRLIAVVHFNRGKVFVRHVLTHKEYDIGEGKTIDILPDKAANLPANYLALIRRFPLRPIQSEEDLDRAVAVMNSLLDRNELDAAEDDYLDVLSDLVARFEDKHHPIAEVSGEAVFRFLIDQKCVKQAEVARITGIAESTLSAILAGKRQLTRAQIGKVAAYFHVNPAVFLPKDSDSYSASRASKAPRKANTKR